MPNSTLPSRPSLEYLRKLAKDRLPALRGATPGAKLADALLAVAQDHGFPSWRALKAEIERRRGDLTSRWFEAVRRCDADTVRTLLREDRSLVQARESRHDATALHVAAAANNVQLARMLLDAGADPNDTGDDEHIGVIGWATFFAQPGDVRRDVVSLLVERGARYHIFSAIALGDLDVIRTLVEQHPETLDARLSPRHHGQTALHFAIARGRADILDLLIELDADLDATDHNGQTAVEFARLRGNRQAAERLLDAGARQPVRRSVPEAPAVASGLANSIQSSTPVIGSRDVDATLAWYTSLGFTEVARYPTDGSGVFWGLVTLGKAEITFDVRETAGARGVSLLFVTDRVQDLYEFLKSRQLERADVEFVQTLHEPVHGGLEFSIRDPNGLTLRFLQEAK
jgi:ankyrin repeat protein/catechol 2,3-dioxygenase-like lactoylglutathione lyase family enzyme